MDASFTFDPSSGVAQAVNQTISTGASFAATYSVTTMAEQRLILLDIQVLQV